MMKHAKILSVILTVLLIFSVIPVMSNATENEHITEVPDGYIGVYDVTDLYCIRFDLSSNYILMNNIDLSKDTAPDGDWSYDGRGWDPIGSNSKYGNTAFSGIFDGNGYAVTGMRIDLASTLPSGTSTSYLGLFSEITGTVKNLTIEGSIQVNNGNTDFAGGIAGMCSVGGRIENCKNMTDIRLHNGSSGKTYPNEYAGGICGYNAGTISRCINIADIYSSTRAGYYDNNARYSDALAGGISGFNNSVITDCINSGKIVTENPDDARYARGFAAGISNNNNTNITNNGTISNCYNTGAINGSTSYGIASNLPCTNCYNVGSVSENGYAISNYSANQCYFLKGIGKEYSGSTSLSEPQMKIKQLYSGFDFENVWTMDGRSDYPYPELRDVNLIFPDDIAEHEHSYIQQTIAPTCTQNGYTLHKCDCGDSYKENETPSTGHKFTSPDSCSNCGLRTDGLVSFSTVTARPGRTFDIYVKLNESVDVKSMAIYDLIYDTDKLTLEKGEWLTQDAVISDWNQTEETGAICFNENTTVEGNLFRLTFKTKKGLEDSTTAINCTFVIKQKNNNTEKELGVQIATSDISIVNILRGDVNGDDVVDSNDAIHLLYFTLIPDRYEINQNCDFDNSGTVDSDDSIYLLYHTLLPERYPLN